MGAKRLTNAEKQRIRELAMGGMSGASIATKLGRSQACVSRAMKHMRGLNGAKKKATVLPGRAGTFAVTVIGPGVEFRTKIRRQEAAALVQLLWGESK